MKKAVQLIMVLFVTGSLVSISGCTIMQGTPSLTFLSRDINTGSPNIEVLGDMDSETDTFTWFLIFGFSGKSRPNHEAPITRLLDKYDADVLLESQMTVSNVGLPYIFMQSRYTVEGIPARFVKGDAQ
ncbi:MAG: hypothetical protein JXM72_10600 [Deltaproteobacteria bacterium]|nr:hypothetical protein [Deltaproteobacteria bacterium]